jgi:hypothetical protein
LAGAADALEMNLVNTGKAASIRRRRTTGVACGARRMW